MHGKVVSFIKLMTTDFFLILIQKDILKEEHLFLKLSLYGKPLKNVFYFLKDQYI